MAKQERIRIRLKAYDHKTLDQSAAKNRRHGETYRCYGIRTDSASDRKEHLHDSSFSPCQQRLS